MSTLPGMSGCRKFLLLPLCLLVFSHSSAAFAIDCADMVPGYLSWMKKGPGTGKGAHMVGVKMSTVKVKTLDRKTYPWGYGSYAEGRLGWRGDEMTGRLKVLFSDRWTDGRRHRFARGKSDVQDVTVFADGKVRIILQGWGGAKFFLKHVRCYRDGFITGLKHEKNGVSMVTLALRKEISLPGKDGFRDWP